MIETNQHTISWMKPKDGSFVVHILPGCGSMGTHVSTPPMKTVISLHVNNASGFENDSDKRGRNLCAQSDIEPHHSLTYTALVLTYGNYLFGLIMSIHELMVYRQCSFFLCIIYTVILLTSLTHYFIHYVSLLWPRYSKLLQREK